MSSPGSASSSLARGPSSSYCSQSDSEGSDSSSSSTNASVEGSSATDENLSSAEAGSDTTWEENFDEDGTPYYWNPRTEESRWTKPRRETSFEKSEKARALAREKDPMNSFWARKRNMHLADCGEIWERACCGCFLAVVSVLVAVLADAEAGVIFGIVSLVCCSVALPLCCFNPVFPLAEEFVAERPWFHQDPHFLELVGGFIAASILVACVGIVGAERLSTWVTFERYQLLKVSNLTEQVRPGTPHIAYVFQDDSQVRFLGDVCGIVNISDDCGEQCSRQGTCSPYCWATCVAPAVTGEDLPPANDTIVAWTGCRFQFFEDPAENPNSDDCKKICDGPFLEGWWKEDNRPLRGVMMPESFVKSGIADHIASCAATHSWQLRTGLWGLGNEQNEKTSRMWVNDQGGGPLGERIGEYSEDLPLMLSVGPNPFDYAESSLTVFLVVCGIGIVLLIPSYFYVTQRCARIVWQRDKYGEPQDRSRMCWLCVSKAPATSEEAAEDSESSSTLLGDDAV